MQEMDYKREASNGVKFGYSINGVKHILRIIMCICAVSVNFLPSAYPGSLFSFIFCHETDWDHNLMDYLMLKLFAAENLSNGVVSHLSLLRHI